MTNTTKNILMVFAALAGFLGLVVAFNYSVDPMCFYRCDVVNLERKTQNVYYRSLQTVLANPDAQVLILGSSRGERIPPKWVESKTGLKTINVSVGGADLFLKLALINQALENGNQLKKVIWVADYFELVSSLTDAKVYLTPVIWHYSTMDKTGKHQTRILELLQRLIDHRTFEAGLEMIKKDYNETYSQDGGGDDIDYVRCQQPDFVGPTSKEMMPKKISEEYNIFSKFLAMDQDPIYMRTFEEEIQKLANRGVEVIINIAPYHREVMDKALKEIPGLAEKQKAWVARVAKLAGPQVKVLRNEMSLPGDDGGPRYWEDGAHPTCWGSMELLKAGL